MEAAITSSEVRRRRVPPTSIAFVDGSPTASSAGPSSWGEVRTPSNRSPSFSNRSKTLSIRKSCGVTPSSTSSHRNGVETVAPASGRIEYTAEMFAPRRFMLWSMKTLPVRLSICHAIVTCSRSARSIVRPSVPTKSRTWS